MSLASLRKPLLRFGARHSVHACVADKVALRAACVDVECESGSYIHGKVISAARVHVGAYIRI